MTNEELLQRYIDTGLEPEEINRTPITKNKNIELPCFAGDTVYYIKYPTYAASWRNDKPVMVSMKVIKVTYEAQQGFEKIRIDTSYKNNFGDDSFDFFIWDDGFLYNTLAEAEEKIKAFSQAHEKGNQIEEAEKALEEMEDE